MAETDPIFRVDRSVERPAGRWDDAPDWFRRAPGLWCPNPSSGGSVLLTFVPREPNHEDLCDRIKSYRELPDLLARARAQGTDLVYLTDWYEGLPGTSCDEYWRHKATYEPRADLGGKAALVDGLAAVKAAGGHVLLYVEPFIIDKDSALGRKRGDTWALKPDGKHPDDPYPGAWKLCPAAPGVLEHFVEIAHRVVGEYGASGLFLDSYGNQRGWRCSDRSHGHPLDEGRVFDEAARKLVRGMLEAARSHDPKAVVMIEGSKMPAMGNWAAGMLDWGLHELVQRWSWREAGHLAVFTAGWSLDDMHQILATGQRVALGGEFWTTAPTGTCKRQVAEAIERGGNPREGRMRRYAAEEAFRELHRFRNAGLLLGRPMPSLDAVTMRRWDGNELFEGEASWARLKEACGEAAEDLDRALEGRADLPACKDHVRRVLTARSEFWRVVKDAEVDVLQAPSSTAAAYRFSGPGGVGLSCVNVSDEPLRATLPTPGGGAFEDLFDGSKVRAKGGLEVEVPPHSVRFWASTG